MLSVLILIIVLATLTILCFLFKRFIKLFIVLGIVYLIFHIGFVWSLSDLQSNFNIFQFLKSQYQQTAESGYKSYTEKRDSNGVVDTQAIANTVDNSLSSTVSSAQKSLNSVDKTKLLNDVDQKIQEFHQKLERTSSAVSSSSSSSSSS